MVSGAEDSVQELLQHMISAAAIVCNQEVLIAINTAANRYFHNMCISPDAFVLNLYCVDC